MNSYLTRLLVVAVLFLFFIALGVVITQQAAGRLPLHPEQVSETTGVYDFTWSPDGKFIAFISSQSGNPEVWTVPANGGPARRITSTGSAKESPRWSNDGRWIAFVAGGAGETGDIHLVSPDGEQTMILTETPSDEADPSWSPDSRRIVFSQRGSRNFIAVTDIESRVINRLAEIPASSPQWSPDGKAIVFVSDPLLPSDDRRENEDLFLIPAEGGQPRLLTPGTPRFRDFAPSWSSDSRQIVYASESNGYSNIYIVDVSTGARRPWSTAMVDHLAPKWSPDEQRIAYVSNRESQFHIWISPIESGRAIQISDRDGVNGGFESEDLTPRGTLKWSPDGKRIAFTHSDPGRTADIWIADLDGSRTLQLTNSMPPELRREARFVWPDLMTYRSFDGQEISALVYKPRGPKPRSGYAALLIFRDTIDGQNAQGWNPFVQFFVSDGYVVFAPNVRGSSGKGKDHRQLVYQHGGDHDVRDAFIGLDRLSSEGLIDAERVGVFGAGTGGFLTTAALIKDETRFKAAVCLYGIVDAVTASSYPGMGAWTRYMIGSTPMTNPLPYYERSLINYVDKLRTPIVFLYAGGDASAPFQQLQQFAVQAEVKGKWFDYRVFEGESGGWQYWRPSNLRQALEAMDALFEKHLLGRDREIRLSRNR